MAEENKQKPVKENEEKKEAPQQGGEPIVKADIKEAGKIKEPGPETANLSVDEKTADKPKKTGTSKKPQKTVKLVSHGRAYIKASYNNTIVTFTDLNGNTLAWSSAGICGFKGPKKATPYAAGVIVRDVANKVQDCGLREVNVFVRGVGSGREAAVRALNANGIEVLTIQDVTPIPHGGVRMPRPRRV